MPRRARLRAPGLPLHIGQRGHNGDPCFFGDTDRLVYLRLLEDQAAKFDCAVHAYVLMSNHVHLLVTPREPIGASLLMKLLGQQYVQYINRSRRRTGSLWEGRFHSNVVDTNAYLMRCYRYIELNPVRAGMVATPGAYPWSSHRANAWGHANALIDPHPTYVHLGSTTADRVAAYEALFDTPLDERELREIRDALAGGLPLGDDEFREAIAPRASGRQRRRRPQDVVAKCRTKQSKGSDPE